MTDTDMLNLSCPQTKNHHKLTALRGLTLPHERGGRAHDYGWVLTNRRYRASMGQTVRRLEKLLGLGGWRVWVPE